MWIVMVTSPKSLYVSSWESNCASPIHCSRFTWTPCPWHGWHAPYYFFSLFETRKFQKLYTQEPLVSTWSSPLLHFTTHSIMWVVVVVDLCGSVAAKHLDCQSSPRFFCRHNLCCSYLGQSILSLLGGPPSPSLSEQEVQRMRLREKLTFVQQTPSHFLYEPG